MGGAQAGDERDGGAVTTKKRQKNELTRQLVVRVDEQLWEWLQADAETYGRTVAQSVRFILRKLHEAER